MNVSVGYMRNGNDDDDSAPMLADHIVNQYNSFMATGKPGHTHVHMCMCVYIIYMYIY